MKTRPPLLVAAGVAMTASAAVAGMSSSAIITGDFDWIVDSAAFVVATDDTTWAIGGSELEDDSGWAMGMSSSAIILDENEWFLGLDDPSLGALVWASDLPPHLAAGLDVSREPVLVLPAADRWSSLEGAVGRRLPMIPMATVVSSSSLPGYISELGPGYGVVTVFDPTMETVQTGIANADADAPEANVRAAVLSRRNPTGMGTINPALFGASGCCGRLTSPSYLSGPATWSSIDVEGGTRQRGSAEPAPALRSVACPGGESKRGVGAGTAE
ncbi:MAG: hypothetical protein GY898_02000 [Proteobacteria bacterium]|nr:hypothetical protein [Pseudomonadota bacterium]